LTAEPDTLGLRPPGSHIRVKKRFDGLREPRLGGCRCEPGPEARRYAI
jgi:hypothetical protein